MLTPRAGTGEPAGTHQPLRTAQGTPSLRAAIAAQKSLLVADAPHGPANLGQVDRLRSAHGAEELGGQQRHLRSHALIRSVICVCSAVWVRYEVHRSRRA